MKSHSSKASRKSFDVTKMSGPEIAAEMSRQMTEFKSARKHSDPAISRQESASAEPHSKQAGNHHFLRASLAAGAGSAVSLSSLRGRDLQPNEPSGPQSEGPRLAFLRRGAPNERSSIIAERRAPQYPREWSYREGLLAGASLVLLLIGIGAAALWQSGTLPELIERSLQATLRSPAATRSEPAPDPIVSPQVAAAPSPAAVDQAAPPPPTPIILMVTPAPTATGNPTLTVDTLSAITVLQPEAPAIDIDQGNLQSLMSDDGGSASAVPLRVETAAGLSVAPLAASSSFEVLKHLTDRPSLKPALDVAGPAEPATTSTVLIGIGAAMDAQPEEPFVAVAKPFVPQGTSSALGQKAANAAPDLETSALEQLPAQTLSPLPPPIVIRSIGHVSGAPGAASVAISEPPAGDGQGAATDTSLHGRRNSNSETDAGGGDGPDLADTQPDRSAASGRGHGSPSGGVGGGGSSGGGIDPGNGTGGSGGTDGSGGSAGGSTGGDGGTGGSDGGTGGDADGGGDGGSDGGTGGGSDSGAGGDGGSDGGGGEADGGGGSDGGSGGGSDGGAAGDGGSDGGGGESDGGDGGSDGDGGDGGGDSSSGDGGSTSGDNDGSSAGGDDGSAGGGGLGGALGGLGGALGGALGGN